MLDGCIDGVGELAVLAVAGVGGAQQGDPQVTLGLARQRGGVGQGACEVHVSIRVRVCVGVCVRVRIGVRVGVGIGVGIGVGVGVGLIRVGLGGVVPGSAASCGEAARGKDNEHEGTELHGWRLSRRGPARVLGSEYSKRYGVLAPILVLFSSSGEMTGPQVSRLVRFLDSQPTNW